MLSQTTYRATRRRLRANWQRKPFKLGSPKSCCIGWLRPAAVIYVPEEIWVKWDANTN
jgi:hypothetical protein